MDRMALLKGNSLDWLPGNGPDSPTMVVLHWTVLEPGCLSPGGWVSQLSQSGTEHSEITVGFQFAFDI